MPDLLVTEERVAMRDGVHLATDVCRANDDVRRPVLLVRTPYGRGGVVGVHDAVGAARRGWAVVMQDVRGRGGSEGEFQAFVQEPDDGFDTIAWCAEQPWSDGRVAMTGYSYNGATQWLAAAAHPPALKAISPSVIGPDFLNDLALEGGAFQQGFLSAWAIGLAASSPDPDVAARALPLIPRWPDVPAREVAAVLPDFEHWSEPEHWASLPVAEIDLPMWRLAGWYDVFCEGTLRGYTAMSDRGAQRLIVGPWTHIGMFVQSTPEMDFGSEANGLVLAGELEKFLLAGLDGKAPACTGITVFVMGINQWRDLPSWPPPATTHSLHLGPDEQLLSAPPAPAQLTWKHDPDDPVPTRGGRTLMGGLPLAGPTDQRPLLDRDDVLVWTSEVLTEDLTVIGTITAELEVSSTATDFDLAVKICDVHPDGRSLNIVDSIQRTTAADHVHVAVGSTAMTFRAGHRIQVLLASSSAPRFDVLPAAEHTVHLGRSRVLLPLLLPVLEQA